MQLISEQNLEQVPVLLGRQVPVLLCGQGQADLDVAARSLRLPVRLLQRVPTFESRRRNVLKLAAFIVTMVNIGLGFELRSSSDKLK